MKINEILCEDTTNTAISLSRLGKFHRGEYTLGEVVPERLNCQFALHPEK